MSTRQKDRFVICTSNTGASDLVLSKVYEVLQDTSLEKSKLLRVVDESGEDYVYPEAFFRAIELPLAIRRAIKKNHQASSAA